LDIRRKRAPQASLEQLLRKEFPVMNDRMGNLPVTVGIVICCLAGVYIVIFRTAYLSNSSYLATLIFLQIMFAVLWNYRSRFFVLLIAVFLLAGLALPFRGAWISARWYVLIMGALVGYVVYMKDRHHRFTGFHLVAFFCVLAAVVSAIVSSYPTQSLLKASSLFLLFLYGSSGARLAVVGREARFFPAFVLGSELLIYATAVSYFVIHFELFGNPNSLGSVIGVVLVPVMLWGVLISEDVTQRRRRVFALMLAIVLLLSSYARAGFAAATISCLLVCVSLRQYRLLIKGIGFLVLAAMLVAITMPPPDKESSSVVSAFLHKGKREEDVFVSRKSPWDRTVSLIQQNPWFGTGFGTSFTDLRPTRNSLDFQSLDAATREHGNSYLAIAEWVGLLGVVPFYTLVFLVLLNVRRVVIWMRQTGNQFSPAVLLAAIMAGGLVHAAFEDWLFAVGYYLTVVFWVFAFVLVDLLPATAPIVAHSRTARPSRQWLDPFGVALPGR
jgi:O-antigen ligase